MLADRQGGSLDDEHVGAADRVLEAEVGRAVCERRPLDPRQLDAEMAGDLAASSGCELPATTAVASAASATRPGRASAAAPSSPCPRGRAASAQSSRFPPRPSLLICRGGKPASALSGTSSVMTAPAAVHASSPTVTGATNIVSTATRTLLPIDVLPLGRPGRCGKFAVIDPAPMLVPSPISASPMYEEMRHLRVLADGRLLDLDEHAGLRARAEDGSGAKVTERTDRRLGPISASIATTCRPTSAPAATFVRPRRTVNGRIVAVRLDRHARLDQVEPGSAIATPASMCSRLTRSRSVAAAAASSTRVLTPSASSGSPATWATTRSPRATRSRTASVR